MCSPSLDNVKNLQGLGEVILRGLSIVVSFTSIIAASVYMGIFKTICDFMETAASPGKLNPDNHTIGNCETFQYRYTVQSPNGVITHSGSFTFLQTTSIIFILALSTLVIVYQLLAVLQLFLNVKPLSIRKTCCKSTCSIFSMIDVPLLIIFAILGFVGGLFATSLASSGWPDVVKTYKNIYETVVIEVYDNLANYITSSNIGPTAAAVAVFSFLSMLSCGGIVVYFIVWKVFKLCKGQATYEAIQD